MKDDTPNFYLETVALLREALEDAWARVPLRDSQSF